MAQHVKQHGLNHEAVVVVPVKTRPVAIETVAHVPLFVRAHGVIDPHGVEALPNHGEGGLHDGGEKQPVVLSRRDRAGGDQARRQILLRAGVQLVPQFVGRAQERLRQESAVHQRLRAFMEVEEVGRLRVRAGADRLPREAGVALLQIAFGTGVERRFQPGRDAGEQPSDGLQVGHLAPVGHVAGDALHRHIPFQRPGGQIGQHRFRHRPQHPHPILAVGFRGLGRGLEAGSRGSGPRHGPQKCTPMIHDASV